MKSRIVIYLSFIIGIVVLSSGVRFGRRDIGAAAAVRYYAEQVILFSRSSHELLKAIESINTDSASTIRARLALRDCRLRYKSISFFCAYFFPSETAMYNAAPKYEVEEPELELVEPMGLQQIEALLFEDDVYHHKSEVLDQARAFDSSVQDLKTLLYQFEAKDSQILESLKLEMIRIISLYIAGYDAPLLKSGISESLQSMNSMEVVLQPYLAKPGRSSQVLAQMLHKSIMYLQSHQDFDSFDRMTYLVNYALPLQEHLSTFTMELGLQLNTSAYLNDQSANLFRPDFLKSWDSIEPLKRQELALLGSRLFFDTGLSGNSKVSCGSCHKPELYFADGQIKSPAILKDSVLKRNTPSLLYAGFQHAQFWDGRVKTMAGQIKDVLYNPLEMGSNEARILAHINSREGYVKSFRSLFPVARNEKRLDQIAMAITAFVSGLSPFNSAFDRYVAGDRNAMTAGQIAGFNLFMGKAQCGTCHFAPYFNSLVPPFYDISEVEVLGTTKTDDMSRPQADPDPGRYDLYQIKYYQQAFKTPTVRNAAKTAPYMHNGAFKTLESVIEFYNQGGAIGLGLPSPNQTLSSRPLNMSKQQTQALIQFINSLTDSKITK